MPGPCPEVVSLRLAGGQIRAKLLARHGHGAIPASGSLEVWDYGQHGIPAVFRGAIGPARFIHVWVVVRAGGFLYVLYQCLGALRARIGAARQPLSQNHHENVA
jgi:hypothetical protein